MVPQFRHNVRVSSIASHLISLSEPPPRRCLCFLLVRDRYAVHVCLHRQNVARRLSYRSASGSKETRGPVVAIYPTLSSEQKQRLAGLAVFALHQIGSALEQRMQPDDDDEWLVASSHALAIIQPEELQLRAACSSRRQQFCMSAVTAAGRRGGGERQRHGVVPARISYGLSPARRRHDQMPDSEQVSAPGQRRRLKVLSALVAAVRHPAASAALQLAAVSSFSLASAA